jgi:ABC-type lipopolysaccharide export system ATPase subunit
MSDELAIEVSELAKSYRGVRVLRGIDLRVPSGSVFALLDPNGAGKTNLGLRHFVAVGFRIRDVSERSQVTQWHVGPGRRVLELRRWPEPEGQ